MKELAADESVSEEARESAKKALEVLVSSELVEIEQAAARRKRAGELQELESEAQFEVKKLEAEAAAKRNKVFIHAPDGLSEDMTAWLQRNRVQHCATDLARIAGAYAQAALSLARFV